MYQAAFVVLLAGVVAGMTGFGFALVVVPVLMILMLPRMVVALIQLLALGLQLMVLVESRRHVAIRRVWLLILGGVVQSGTSLLVSAW